MGSTFAVGSAPWETQSAPPSGSFPVGQAPWEQSTSPSPAAPPKPDLLQRAADIGNAIFPGTKTIGESIAKAGTNIYNLATGGVKKFNQNLPDNTVDVPKLAGAVAGNAGEIATAAIPGVGPAASLALRTAAGRLAAMHQMSLPT